LSEILEKHGLYLVSLIASVLVLGSYVVIILESLWIGETDVLLPIKISLIIGFIFAIGYPLSEIVTSIMRKNWKRTFLSLLVIMSTVTLAVAFIEAIRELIYGREIFVLLTTLSLETRILATIGLVLTYLFFLYSIYHFLMYFYLWLLVQYIFKVLEKRIKKTP
jgi:hypothetical protein